MGMATLTPTPMETCQGPRTSPNLPRGPEDLPTGPNRVYCNQLFADNVSYANTDRAKRPQTDHGAKSTPLIETFNGNCLATLKLRLEKNWPLPRT